MCGIRLLGRPVKLRSLSDCKLDRKHLRKDLIDMSSLQDVSLSSIGRTTSSPGKELATTAGRQSSGVLSPQVFGINQLPENHMNPENATSG